jgi:hypothetical protein
MASLLWKSVPNGPDVVTIVIAESQYSFANNIPQEIPTELVATAITKLTALAATASATTGTYREV